MTTSSTDSCSHDSLPGLVPTARQMIVPVVEQVRLARDTYRLRLAAPELAREVVPGQFFMIRASGVTNPLLGRPFALYDVWLDRFGNPAGIDIAYLVVGKMTGLMATWTPGERVEVWGPLGNGFPVADCERLLLVAGGIGNTPFPAVARESLGLHRYGRRAPAAALAPDGVTFCYGVRSAEYLSGLEDFAAMNVETRVATDDGSRGHKGFVTDLVAEVLDSLLQKGDRHLAAPEFLGGVPLGASPLFQPAANTRIYCCGPEPMMHAVAKLAAEHNVRCWLSLETPMACGVGACFSCVTRVKQPDGQWDYRRTCVEGPIFPAEQLVL